VVQIVGRDADLDKAAAALGNSLKELNEAHFIPLFIGLFLGVALGTMPIAVPGLPQPVKLGLAGGPLIVTLVLGRVGHTGRLACHMPVSANLALREFGIALFFAAVGLDAGAKFFATVFSSIGVQWLLAGSTTNPPALSFAANIVGSEAPAVAYATVYPLTMLLRILCAQVLALTLIR
jgi:putative transport protein